MICDNCKENNECTFKYMIRTLGNPAVCNHFTPDNQLSRKTSNELSEVRAVEAIANVTKKEFANTVYAKAEELKLTADDYIPNTPCISLCALAHIFEELGVKIDSKRL